MQASINTINTEFEALNKLRILVLGDVMIDSYLWGTSNRMSPEAPVPVLSVDKREKRLGGAANVAKNLKALGVDPVVISVIGDDADGQKMIDLFKENGLSTKGLVLSSDRITTIKHRIISDKHLLRVDSEQLDDVPETLEDQLLNKLRDLIKDSGCVIFQDYNKGVLTKRIITESIDLCNELKVPSTVDPKKNNFSEYKGVTLFKPNLKEMNEGLGENLSGSDIPSVIKVAREWLLTQNIDKILITLSENGAVLVTATDAQHLKAHKRKILDVSGAGDTVISVASAFLGLGNNNADLLCYSNLSGGLVCEKMGVVPINKQELLNEVCRIKGLS